MQQSFITERTAIKTDREKVKMKFRIKKLAMAIFAIALLGLFVVKTNKKIAFCAYADLNSANSSAQIELPKTNSSQSPKERLDLVLKDANAYIENEYGISNYYPKSIEVNGEVFYPSIKNYDEYKIISYWNDSSLESINLSNSDKIISKLGDIYYDENEVIYRYIAYDKWGKRMYNPLFPPDALRKDPKDYKMVAWQDMQNSAWTDIINDVQKTEVKEKVLRNFKKSLMQNFEIDIKLYFLYRNPTDGTQEQYIENWKNGYKTVFQEDISEKVNVVMLPSKNANGLAVHMNSLGYYTAIMLRYQEKTDAVLKVHHVAVEKSGDSYRVIKGFSPISDYSEKRMLKQGESVEISCLESPAYTCVGHTFLENAAPDYKALGAGERLATLFKSPVFHYRYNYGYSNDTPVLTFYYVKNPREQFDSIGGSIIVSSKKYDVSRKIPSDEDVRILANIDDRIYGDVVWGRVKKSVFIPVVFAHQSASEYVDGFEIGVEYSKLHDYSIYGLSGLRVNNKNLSDPYPIYMAPKNKVKASALPYSENILGINFSSPSVHIAGREYYFALERLSSAELEDMVSIGSLNPSNSGGSMYAVVIKSGPDTGDFFQDGFYLDEVSKTLLMRYISRNSSLNVRNDALSVGNQVLSTGEVHANSAPVPSDLQPEPMQLVKPAHHIDERTLNGRADTTGNLVYTKLLSNDSSSEASVEFLLRGNDVFIHTPALNHTTLSDESEFDQRANKPDSLQVVPLDHICEISIGANGRHVDARGYGERDYTEHIRQKLLRLPFDAYVSVDRDNLLEPVPKSEYYAPAGTILTYAPELVSVFFKAAPWVRENLYNIETYSVPTNALPSSTFEDAANLDFNNYLARRIVSVRVVGRLFDFCIERIYDPGYYSANTNDYWTSGSQTKDGYLRKRYALKSKSDSLKNMLPIAKGKSPLSVEINQGVKLGYPFMFSVKSMGSYFLDGDVVIGVPRFYHLSETGEVNRNIAVYYSRAGKMIRVGSPQDDMRQLLVFSDFLRPIAADKLIETENLLRKSYGALKSNSDTLKGMPLSAEHYKTQISRPVFAYQAGVFVLSYPFRTFIGQPTDSDTDLSSRMSTQKWTGIYSLPESSAAFELLPDGSPNVNKRLSSGYIGVYFDLSISRNNNRHGSELKYETSTYNGWRVEAYATSQDDLTLIDGTAVLYSLDESAEDDRLVE